MAKATRTDLDYMVTLTLSGKEAEALLKMCGNIVDSHSGPGEHISNIFYALKIVICPLF